MPSFLPTHGGTLKIVDGGKLGASSATHDANSADRQFVQGASSFSFWAMVLSEHCNTVVVTHLGNCQSALTEA